MKIKPSDAVAGSADSGLYPLDRSRIEQRIVIFQDQSQKQSALDTPRKLREIIVSAITPLPTEQKKSAMANSKKKRKQVQAKTGEVLTADDMIERLKEEEYAREKRRERNKKRALQVNPVFK